MIFLFLLFSLDCKSVTLGGNLPSLYVCHPLPLVFYYRLSVRMQICRMQRRCMLSVASSAPCPGRSVYSLSGWNSVWRSGRGPLVRSSPPPMSQETLLHSKYVGCVCRFALVFVFCIVLPKNCDIYHIVSEVYHCYKFKWGVMFKDGHFSAGQKCLWIF